MRITELNDTRERKLRAVFADPVRLGWATKEYERNQGLIRGTIRGYVASHRVPVEMRGTTRIYVAPKNTGDCDERFDSVLMSLAYEVIATLIHDHLPPLEAALIRHALKGRLTDELRGSDDYTRPGEVDENGKRLPTRLKVAPYRTRGAIIGEYHRRNGLEAAVIREDARDRAMAAIPEPARTVCGVFLVSLLPQDEIAAIVREGSPFEGERLLAVTKGTDDPFKATYAYFTGSDIGARDIRRMLREHLLSLGIEAAPSLYDDGPEWE